jgi:DNA-binding helix-hairpin-helix protein with protein kinase domain
MSGEAVHRSLVGTLGVQLGAGGQGRVFLAPEISLPDVPGPLVYKQYLPGHLPPHGLAAVVARRLRMDDATRSRLDRAAVWPVRLVEDGGQVSGVLMRLIPDEFFQERTKPSGAPTRTLREVLHLFVDPGRSNRLGMPSATMAQRLMLCRSFASVLHLLHRNDLVVGDLNGRNAVFALGTLPEVRLVDCDAVRIKGSMPVVRQLNAPDWDPPENQLSQASDLYKFGLFVLRCLGPGTQASVSRDPARAGAVLDGEGLALVRAALAQDPNRRTTAQSWGRYFDRVLTGRQAAGWKRDPVTKKWVPC